MPGCAKARANTARGILRFVDELVHVCAGQPQGVAPTVTRLPPR
jgi:hypothetical protein